MICHSLLGNRTTRIPCVIGTNSAPTTAKSLKMRQINSCINHFEIELNLTLLEAGIYQAGIQEICFCKNGAKTMNQYLKNGAEYNKNNCKNGAI